jgi:hypothetical protein
LFKGKPILTNNNPFLVHESYIINLLQKHNIIDKNIRPTWRVKYLKTFIKRSKLNMKLGIEEKLDKYDKWLKIYYSN